jgi:hypothetical protein
MWLLLLRLLTWFLHPQELLRDCYSRDGIHTTQAVFPVADVPADAAALAAPHVAAVPVAAAAPLFAAPLAASPVVAASVAAASVVAVPSVTITM